MTGQNTNNLSDAIRNLIVCDTQFGWTGETTLKLPELLDLQARGWLIEGDDNCEFSLTDEGQAVVARALQQDAPAELAHTDVLEIVARYVGKTSSAFRYIKEDLTTRHAAALDDALAATGKQQGERERFEKWASHWRRGLDLGRANGGLILVDGEYLDGMAASMWECWQAALAARQPGAQEPALFANRWEMEHGTASGLVAMRAGRHLGIREFFTVPLYAAPPAQGIDPGQLRALAEQWKQLEYPFSYEGNHAQRATDACCADLLALIDQSDAAPGVSHG